MPFSLLARFANRTRRCKGALEAEHGVATQSTGRLIGRTNADVAVIGNGERGHGSAMSRSGRSLARDRCGAPAFAFRDMQSDI